MLKLYLIIYSASGAIGGVVGPLPGLADCEAYVANAASKMAARPDLPQLRFACEYHEARPKLCTSRCDP